MKKALKILSVIMFSAAGFCLLYFLLCILFGGIRLSVIYAWPFCAAVFSGVGFITNLARKKEKTPFNIAALLLNVTAIGFVISFVVFSVSIGISASKPADKNADYIIVLGAAVNYDKPSRTLKYRIDAAAEYLKENQNTVAVCTGGVGKDGDIISEGKCTADWLIAAGIPQERVIAEEESTSTDENFRFALECMSKKPESIVIVSSGFHLHRAKQLLEEMTDAEVSTLPAKDDFFVLHYVLREYIIKFIGEY